MVHSDLCGPFAVRSSGGAQYFIVYIDDYSHHAEITVLPDKRTETCKAAFQWFQANVDGWGYDIRRYRSGNVSAEYNNKTFRSILAVRDISFEPWPPHTQHKNGIAEMMIGVLTQKARAMMLDSQAPMHFWAEAINTACYLHRRTPNQSLDGKTPYEVLKFHRRLYRSGYYANSQRVSTSPNANPQREGTAIGNSQNVGTALDGNSHVGRALDGNPHVGRALDGNSQSVGTALDGNSQDLSTRPTSAEDKPTLDHPRRFGCVVWKHIPKSQRQDAKMGARAKACMMLGYVHDTTKIWRIWDPDFGKAVNCSDLYSDESQTAYTSCMADNERSSDPRGLRKEEPVVTEVMDDSPEAENPDTAPEQGSNPAAVLDTPAVTPPTMLGTLEEVPAPDPQSEPDGAIAAIPSQPRMLTRSQSRRAAKAGIALFAVVTTDDDPRS